MLKKILLLAMAMYLTGCSVANTVRMMYANDDIVPNWTKGHSTQVFEAVYIGDKPYIHATLNGTKLLFLIDTGASFSMLFDTEKGKNLAITRGYDLAISGWGEGESTPAYQTTINQFALGEILFEQVKLAYIPLSTTSYYINKNEAIFDGVIGHDLLRHFSWTFDKRNSEITASALAYRFSVKHNVVPFETTFKKISVPVTIDFDGTHQYEREILIDTGSRHYVKLSTQFIKNNKIAFPATITAADFGMSGMVEHDRAAIKKLKIGKETMLQVKANLIPGDDEDDWWVIGNALMNQFVTVIDYHSSKFALTPYEDGEFSSRYNLAGLELRKLRNGNFIVRFVFPDFESERVGVAIGDEISSINGIAAAKVSEADWLSLASKEGELSFCIEQNTCHSITLSSIQGYSKPNSGT